MATPATHFRLRIGAAVLLAAVLGACTSWDQAMRRAESSPVRVVTLEQIRPTISGLAKAPIVETATAVEPAPMLAEQAFEDSPLGARPEPGTGLPPGWYIPEPPTAPEAPESPPVPLDPVARSAALLRQNPWIARFWSELTPVEQSRVTRALTRRSIPGPAPAAWDPMGLTDRLDLLSGFVRAAL